MSYVPKIAIYKKVTVVKFLYSNFVPGISLDIHVKYNSSVYDFSYNIFYYKTKVHVNCQHLLNLDKIVILIKLAS